MADDIARLEVELANLRTKIGNQEELRSLEEGGANSKFRTDFADNESLYKRETILQTRLDTLYRATS